VPLLVAPPITVTVEAIYLLRPALTVAQSTITHLLQISTMKKEMKMMEILRKRSGGSSRLLKTRPAQLQRQAVLVPHLLEFHSTMRIQTMTAISRSSPSKLAV
jgi:hypothetical protein